MPSKKTKTPAAAAAPPAPAAARTAPEAADMTAAALAALGRPVQGGNVSGRIWKQPATERLSAKLKTVKRKSWEQKQADRVEQKRLDAQLAAMKAETERKKEQRRMQQKLKREQKAANEKKAEVTQLITKAHKLKRLNRNQFKRLRKV